MTDRLRIKPEAVEDIRQIRDEYAAIADQLAERFSEELLRVLSLVETMPEAYAIVEREYRQVCLNHFPHVVAYIVNGGSVVVLAVLHGHRNPETWKRRSL